MAVDLLCMGEPIPGVRRGSSRPRRTGGFSIWKAMAAIPRRDRRGAPGRGSLLARLIAGDAPEEAARYAAVAAALTTTGYGAVTPIPRAGAVRALLGG